MDKKLKHLIKNLKDVFDIDEINKIAKETKFVQRKSNITAKDFLTLNVFHGADICSAPLSQLASRYDLLFDTQISKQALDKRFNKHSVKFMQEIDAESKCYSERLRKCFKFTLQQSNNK